MDPVRAAVLLAVVVVVALGSLLYQRRRRRDAGRGASGLPPLPARLIGAADATWVIFTTPLCVTCDAVEADLQTRFPSHTIIKVDATSDPELARACGVKRAPTVLRADARGSITARLVGVEGVRSHVEEGAVSAARPSPTR
jgi:hypothetical protein